jgi:hypothetical protein
MKSSEELFQYWRNSYLMKFFYLNWQKGRFRTLHTTVFLVYIFCNFFNFEFYLFIINVFCFLLFDFNFCFLFAMEMWASQWNTSFISPRFQFKINSFISCNEQAIITTKSFEPFFLFLGILRWNFYWMLTSPQ